MATVQVRSDGQDDEVVLKSMLSLLLRCCPCPCCPLAMLFCCYLRSDSLSRTPRRPTVPTPASSCRSTDYARLLCVLSLHHLDWGRCAVGADKGDKHRQQGMGWTGERDHDFISRATSFPPLPLRRENPLQEPCFVGLGLQRVESFVHTTDRASSAQADWCFNERPYTCPHCLMSPPQTLDRASYQTEWTHTFAHICEGTVTNPPLCFAGRHAPVSLKDVLQESQCRERHMHSLADTLQVSEAQRACSAEEDVRTIVSG